MQLILRDIRLPLDGFTLEVTASVEGRVTAIFGGVSINPTTAATSASNAPSAPISFARGKRSSRSRTRAAGSSCSVPA